MADIYTTLKTRTNQDNVYPNIKVNNIPDGEIVRAKLANNIINESKLADFSVSSGKLQSGSVTQAKLAMGAVDNLKLADGAVTTTKLADGAVTNAKLSDGAVDSNKLSTNAVNRSKLEERGMDLWGLYANICNQEFETFTLVMEVVLYDPAIKIYNTEVSGGYVYHTPVMVDVKRDEQVIIYIKDYGANTWTTITFNKNDPFPSGLDGVHLTDIKGALHYMD